jgi:hypothetical protein
MPNGSPYRGVDNKHAPVALLDELGKSAKLNEGSIQWPGFFIKRLETGLQATSVVIGPDDEELNATDSWKIVWEAVRGVLRSTGGGCPVPPIDVLREADILAATFFRKVPQRYVLVSGLSVASLPGKTIRIGDSTLRPLSPGSRRYRKPPMLEEHKTYSEVRPGTFKRVAVATSGRSVHEAVNRATADLAVLRGLWTVLSTTGSWTMTFGNRTRKPLGMIHSGPIHTLHNIDGAPAENLYWYEPEFVDEIKPFKPKEWEPIEKRRRWALRRLRIVPYRRELREIIARYAVALDQVNLDVAFLHLWSLLEKITDTVGANYDETVSRTVWPYRDRELAAAMLRCMRLYRNRLVHAAHSGHEQDQVALMVKSFVDPHLFRLLRNDFSVTTLEEYGKQLALPVDVTTLERQARRLRKAARFMRKVAEEAEEDSKGD